MSIPFDTDYVRAYQEDLGGIPTAPCEVCGGDVRNHEWADMDPWGFVVNCSVQPVEIEPYEFWEEKPYLGEGEKRFVYRCYRGQCKGMTIYVVDRNTHNQYHNRNEVY